MIAKTTTALLMVSLVTSVGFARSAVVEPVRPGVAPGFTQSVKPATRVAPGAVQAPTRTAPAATTTTGNGTAAPAKVVGFQQSATPAGQTTITTFTGLSVNKALITKSLDAGNGVLAGALGKFAEAARSSEKNTNLLVLAAAVAGLGMMIDSNDATAASEAGPVISLIELATAAVGQKHEGVIAGIDEVLEGAKQARLNGATISQAVIQGIKVGTATDKDGNPAVQIVAGDVNATLANFKMAMASEGCNFKM